MTKRSFGEAANVRCRKY